MPSSRSASPISRGSDPATAAAVAIWAWKLALAPLLVAQALRTRRRALVLPEPDGERSGRVPLRDGPPAATGEPGPPLRLLVAGDSSAAGVGVAHQRDALAAQLAEALQARLRRPVAWQLKARTGLDTAGVAALLRAEPPTAADVALVVSGVNDVVGRVSCRAARAARESLVAHLVGAGLTRHVVFAPLPPIDRFPLLPQPLRGVLGADARRHDGALRNWAAARRDASYADVALDLGAGMAEDGFHPGAALYRATAYALAGPVARVVTAWSDGRAGTREPQPPAAGSGG